MERLNLPLALREYDLETLTTYEAVRLFIARASSVKPGFAVTNANAPAVAAISSTLHGMPLAIELAAARIKLLTPDQILARLEHHLDTLTAGSRDLPERQQTLRGAIAWSYDLLDDGARRLVDRLSVFRGGFQLETAEFVCGPAAEVGGDVIDRIGELVDQSLVRADDEADEQRFSMLETIREYAAEMLDARGEATATQRRLAEAMIAAGRVGVAADCRAPTSGPGSTDSNASMTTSGPRSTGRRAEPEPEVAATLAYLLWRFWQQRGYLNEARARFDAMAAKDWVLEPVTRARFAEAFGGIAYWQSDQADGGASGTTWRWPSGGRSATRSELANALYDRSYADLSELMNGGTPADEPRERQADARRGPRALSRDRRRRRRGQHPVGPGELSLLHRRSQWRPNRCTDSRWSSTDRQGNGRWKPGHSTC